MTNANVTANPTSMCFAACRLLVGPNAYILCAISACIDKCLRTLPTDTLGVYGVFLDSEYDDD